MIFHSFILFSLSLSFLMGNNIVLNNDTKKKRKKKEKKKKEKKKKNTLEKRINQSFNNNISAHPEPKARLVGG